MVPATTRIAVLINPADAANSETMLKDVEAATRSMGLQIQVLNANTSHEIDAAFATFVGEPAPAPDGTGIVAGVKDAANQLQLYLDYAAKTGGRLDFSKPPVSDLFARIFDLRELAAVPPPKASDLPWLLDWTITADGTFKSILYFGIAPPADLIADQAAIKRNATDYEDQEAVALSFIIRISARV